MPVDESNDLERGIGNNTLDKLDRAAAKAIETLERKNKKEEKVFTSEKKDDINQKPQSSDDVKYEIKKGVKEQTSVGFREAFADQAGGLRGAKNVFAFGKNPIGFTKGILRGLPFIGGIVAVGEFGQAILAEIEKLDKFFKKFINARIDDRLNQLITRIQQAKIRSGDIQEILDTQAGGTSPRTPYNTFNEFNKDRLNFENDHSIRTVVDT